MASSTDLRRLLGVYGVPSQALWRACELAVLRQLQAEIAFDPPRLEIGCGDGAFGSLVFDRIDDGIDPNERALARCGRRMEYHRVHAMSAERITVPREHYATVFSNSVFEHIPDADEALAQCYSCLRPGGRLLMTVPLSRMSSGLLSGRSGYVRYRQRKLGHVVLRSAVDWAQAVVLAGFHAVHFRPYLSMQACRAWDALDLPMGIGPGRYTPGGALYWLRQRWPGLSGAADPLVVRALRAIERRTATAAQPMSGEPDSIDSDFCATAIIAER